MSGGGGVVTASSGRWSMSVVITGGRSSSGYLASHATALVFEVARWFFGRLMVVVRAAKWCLMADGLAEPCRCSVTPSLVSGSVVGASGWLVEMPDGLQDFTEDPKRRHDSKNPCTSCLAPEFSKDCKFYVIDTKDTCTSFTSSRIVIVVYVAFQGAKTKCSSLEEPTILYCN
ncbi:hypothetical protein Dimus_026285 [Dionaea muscipula]